MHDFFIQGTPVPQPRQRMRVVTPRGRKPFVQTYTPSDHPVNEWKQTIASVGMIEAQRTHMVDKPCELRLDFVMKRPDRILWKTKPMHQQWVEGKPDLDNLAKAVMDGLNHCLFYDDALIVSLMVTKRYGLAMFDKELSDYRKQPSGVRVRLSLNPVIG